MTDPRQDERWQALQDALATEEAERGDLEVDVRAEPQWRDELDFYDALAEHAMQDALPRAEDEAIIDAALEAVPVGRRPYGVIAVVVALAAAAVLWFAMPRGVELRAAEGSWATAAGDTVASGDALPTTTWLNAGSDACMEHGDARLCARAGARLRVRDAHAHTIELAEGAVEVASGVWSVEMAGTEHVLEAGDVLTAEARRLASNDPVPPVELDAPPPVAPQPEAEAQPETETEAAQETDGEPPVSAAPKRAAKPKADAATLVTRARKARGEGRLAEAERHYGELLRRFAKSPEAAAGRVALAQIKLRRGKAKAALRLFSAAARGGGPLAEEAAWGRIQALDRLGRDDDLRTAVDAFVAKYPTSAYRARAQGRVDR
mgnify:CR=1 FL=1